jgi:hypothetical protein
VHVNNSNQQIKLSYYRATNAEYIDIKTNLTDCTEILQSNVSAMEFSASKRTTINTHFTPKWMKNT